jgi:hypothetical protein
VTEKILETLINNAPLVFALGSLYVLVTPRLIKSTLQNGAGDVVKDIVRSANAEQSKETVAALSAVRERLAVVESRIEDHVKAHRS